MRCPITRRRHAVGTGDQPDPVDQPSRRNVMEVRYGKQPGVSAAPPAGLAGSGRSLWASTTAEFELDEHELAILREACRTATAIDALQAVVDRDGVLNESSQGVRGHPALVELRAQRLCFAKW